MTFPLLTAALCKARLASKRLHLGAHVCVVTAAYHGLILTSAACSCVPAGVTWPKGPPMWARGRVETHDTRHTSGETVLPGMTSL